MKSSYLAALKCAYVIDFPFKTHHRQFYSNDGYCKKVIPTGLLIAFFRKTKDHYLHIAMVLLGL